MGVTAPLLRQSLQGKRALEREKQACLKGRGVAESNQSNNYSLQARSTRALPNPSPLLPPVLPLSNPNTDDRPAPHGRPGCSEIPKFSSKFTQARVGA